MSDLDDPLDLLPPFLSPLNTEAIAQRFRTLRQAKLPTVPVRDVSGGPENAHTPGGSTFLVRGLCLLQANRDQGMFRSGLLLSSDFDRCLTLSLAFHDKQRPGDWRQDHAAAVAACSGFFGIDLPLVWAEPPSTALAVARDLHTYRLFVGEDWRTPVEGAPPTSGYFAWPDWRRRVDPPAGGRFGYSSGGR